MSASTHAFSAATFPNSTSIAMSRDSSLAFKVSMCALLWAVGRGINSITRGGPTPLVSTPAIPCANANPRSAGLAPGFGSGVLLRREGGVHGAIVHDRY